MKLMLKALIFLLVTGSIQASVTLEKDFQSKIDFLNQEIRQELLDGNLAQHNVQKSLREKIGNISTLAEKIGGKKHKNLVSRSLRKTLRALSRLDRKYRDVFNITFENGMTGREIFLEATDPENNRKIVAIYNAKKNLLQKSFSGNELRSRAMDLTLIELNQSKEFDFLKMVPQENFVNSDPVFSFIGQKCSPDYGEEDFFLLLFGIHTCESKKYYIERYTVGLGYYNAWFGNSYVTGLKIGRKAFYGVGATAKIGAYYAGGVSVYLGNGLILSLELEKSYGLYAGVTYMTIKPK
jgi:hypothetical protein